MQALVKLALRNLVAHKGKTLIVGIIIAFGVTILVVGSSFLESASRSLRRSFIDNFTAQVIITGKAHGSVTLFGVAGMGASEGTPTLPDHKKIADYLGGSGEVKSFTSQITGAEQLNKVGEDVGSGGPFVYLFGIDPATYSRMFDNVSLVSGTSLVPGQEGILLSTRQVQEFKKSLGSDLKPGDRVLIQSFGNAIREVTLRGVFDFKEPNAATDLVSYIDPVTLRALLGMAPASGAELKPDAAETALLSSSESSLFQGNGAMVRVATGRNPPLPSTTAPRTVAAAPPLSEAGATGPWQFVLIDLKNPVDAPSFVATTNQWLAGRGIEAVAADWRTAAGPFAVMPELIRVIFLFAILIIAVVAMIIIMNTLVVSVGERTAEIGTMRALGAQKGFVWRMLLLETLAISILFGVAGMILGSALVGVMNLTGIAASGPFLQTIAGSATLRPTVQASSLGTSMVLVIVIAIVAHLYPVRAALRIQPVVAIQTRSE